MSENNILEHDYLTINEGITITIQYNSIIINRNIVCTYNLGIPIDLKQVAMRVRNAEYNPKVFKLIKLEIQCSNIKNQNTKINLFNIWKW